MRMDQSHANLTNYIHDVDHQVFLQHVPTSYHALAGHSHVDMGFQPVSNYVPPAAAWVIPTTGRDLDGEIEDAEGLIRKLQSYWAAVADDLGPIIWAHPTNQYRNIWEQEISSACDKLEQLEKIRDLENLNQIPKTAYIAEHGYNDPSCSSTSGIETPSNQDAWERCARRARRDRRDLMRIMTVRDKSASHMRTLKRKATRQRAKARLVSGALARSVERYGNFARHSDTGQRQKARLAKGALSPGFQQLSTFTRHQDTPGGSFFPRKSIETAHDSESALMQGPMTLDELCHAFSGEEAEAEAEAEAGIRNSQQFNIFRRPSETGRSIPRRESIETVQDQLRALKQELAQYDLESKAERTLYVGEAPHLGVEDLQILFRKYDM